MSNPNPPANLPFAPGIDDKELEAELERYRPDASASGAGGMNATPTMVEPGGMNAAPTPPTPKPPEIRAMPQASLASSSPREPEDMFSKLDQSPKQPVTPTGLGDLPLRSSSSSSALKYALLFVGVVVVLGGLGFAFWYFAIKRPAAQKAAVRPPVTRPSVPVIPVAPAPSVPTPLPPPPTMPTTPDPTLPGSATTDLPPDNTIPAPLPVPVIAPPAGTNIPLPPSMGTESVDTSATTGVLDTDEDGLYDQRELELGTDPRNKDTDDDGLSDGDEVLKYGTNPLDRDTDKDGFIDGKEVQSGYNPRGSDKCAKPDCSI